jgi:hypothetical protein
MGLTHVSDLLLTHFTRNTGCVPAGVVVIMRGPRVHSLGGASGAGAGPAPAADPKQRTLGAFFAKSGAAAAAKDATAASPPPAPAAAPEAAPSGAWSAAGAPLRVSYGLGPGGAHAAEGRTITFEARAPALSLRAHALSCAHWH